MTNVGQISVEAKLDSSQFKKDLKDMEKQTKQSAGNIGVSLETLKKFAGFAGLTLGAKIVSDGIGAIGKETLQTASKFEQLETSFKVLAGGADAGKLLTNQLIELANTTPMTTDALSENARMLLTFGESAQAVIYDLKLLGDITGGDAQKMQSLTLAFAQVGSQGRLMGQDLLQMVNAGFNPLSIMSEKTGKSMTQLKDEMSKGLISFKDVKGAMVAATSEGGRFYGMMNTQSQTLNGRLSTMADKWTLVGKNIGDGFLPFAKSAVIQLTKLAENVMKLQNKISGFHKNLTNQTEASKKQMGNAFTKQANELLELSDYYNKRGNIEYSKSYQRQAEELFNSAKRMYSEADALAAKDSNILEQDSSGGFDSTSATALEKNKKERNKALDEYKSFLEKYQQYEREYQAEINARRYIEKNLGLSEIGEDHEKYEKALEIYKNYYQQKAEIESSSALNKNKLYDLNDNNLLSELDDSKLSKARETAQKLYEIESGYRDSLANMQNEQIAYDDAGGFLGSFSSGYAQRLEIYKWYYDERNRIAKEAGDNYVLAQEAYNQVDILRDAKLAQTKIETWRGYGQEISGIFGNTFSSLLLGQSTFGSAMQSLSANIAQELVNIAWQQAVKEIEIEQMKNAAKAMMNSVGGVWGKIGSGIMNIFGGNHHSGGKILSYHDGTVVPMGASIGSYDLGGTAEQLALLKGGERVLSPAENVSYEQGGSSGANVQVLNFNIKAWNGKDVINTLRENSAVIQQITASGIKNNQNGLRTIVRGV